MIEIKYLDKWFHLQYSTKNTVLCVGIYKEITKALAIKVMSEILILN